ncbi:hypothetical protein GYMLUDRAFT_941572 [Collybiopsis luxurians FD-317 M1]|uniref:Unplaced genomic scaffold GYMLUscaffold_83, whole genome shotgun sequence n=1 Tax=Collybiopsis luxurians FD-317 M1 TaxID=944289 RepID=A0A0D0BF56_9AGAR|nr:hypothetical protein GYMLUDRAFT_941572 [Collybiopsis luxurians FD-317 M1]
MSTDLLDSKFIEFIAGTVVPSTIATSFFYGFYSFLFCIYIQLQSRASRSRLGNSRRPIFFRIFIPALFILISLHVILSAITLYEGLRSQTVINRLYRKYPLVEPDAHYFGFCNFNLAATTMFIVASTVADTTLLYRAYTLWDRQTFIVLAPIILLLSSFGAGLYALVLGQKGGMLIITNFLADDTMLNDAKIGLQVL